MDFILSPDAEAAVDAITARLQTELSANKKVLWFVTGGSNIQNAVAIMSRLSDEQSQHLTVTLTDERYGAVGHPDSNWQQLIAAGFNFRQSDQIPVLTGDLPLEQTREGFETALQRAYSENPVVIGLYGMGPDGHISGILPGSPALGITDLCAAYVTPTYTRVTTTFEAIKKCQVGYLVCLGADRRPALEKLKRDDISLSEQPAQILKQLPEAHVYNNQIGGKL